MAEWLHKATAKMKKKGTLGSFGKATEKKIAAGKRAGGLQKKKAIFAENAKKAAKQGSHNAVGSHDGYRHL